MRHVALVACLLACAAPAFAQQPYTTDKADVTKERAVEISVGGEFDALQSTDTDHSRQTTLIGRLAYGAWKNVELEYWAPVIFLTNRTAPNASGYGDTSASLKWQLREDSERRPAFALSFTVQAPTGNSENDIGSGITMTWINAIAAHKFGTHTVVTGNLGFMPTGNPSTGALGINARRGKIVTSGVMVTHDVTDDLKLGAEINGALTTTDKTAHQVHVVVGANYKLRKALSLDTGVIVGHYARTPRFGVLIGMTLTVPRSAESED